MTLNEPGWAMELKGDKIDLEELRHNLVFPYEPWVEDYEAGDRTKHLLLRSRFWEGMTEAAQVTEDARRLVARLNGAAMVSYNESLPVTVGQPMRFGPDGKRQHILFAASGSYVMVGSRVRGRMSGGSKPQTPQESQLQKWIKAADSDETRADLFVHLSRADNWYDLYKSLELIRRLAGSATEVQRIVGTDWDEWRRVWQTANCHRHAPDTATYPFPPNPPTLAEARKLMLKAVGLILKAVG